MFFLSLIFILFCVFNKVCLLWLSWKCIVIDLGVFEIGVYLILVLVIIILVIL